MNKDFRAGFVAIIGRPNVGKSTLMNNLLGEKLSIISPKPQTTRQQIKGILTDDDKQIIFLDTPGYLEPRYLLQEKMLEYIQNSLQYSDLIIFLTDVRNFPTDYDAQICNILKKLRIPKIAMLNKIDLAEKKIIQEKQVFIGKENFEKVIPISALHFKDFDDIIKLITSFLPYNPPFYDKGSISDLPMRFFAQEIIREQIFLNFKEEIPYSSTVVVEYYHEYPNKVEIAANIWLERKSQKPIVLGRNGEKIKMIRMNSEREIYKVISKKVKLDLWIKIKPNWRKKRNALKEFGFR